MKDITYGSILQSSVHHKSWVVSPFCPFWKGSITGCLQGPHPILLRLLIGFPWLWFQDEHPCGSQPSTNAQEECLETLITMPEKWPPKLGIANTPWISCSGFFCVAWCWGDKNASDKINSNIKSGQNRETAQLMASPRCWRCTHFEVLNSKTTSYVLRKRSFIMSRHRNLALPTWRNLNQFKPPIISCGQDGFSGCYSPS